MQFGSSEYQQFCKASEMEEAGNIAGAVKLYRRLAKLGNVYAQGNLAILLEDKVHPPRRKEAVYWYRRAIRRGYWPAASSMAIHYRDLGKSRWQMHWLKVAAKLGDTDAPREIRKLERQLERDRSRR